MFKCTPRYQKCPQSYYSFSYSLNLGFFHFFWDPGLGLPIHPSWTDVTMSWGTATATIQEQLKGRLSRCHELFWQHWDICSKAQKGAGFLLSHLGWKKIKNNQKDINERVMAIQADATLNGTRGTTACARRQDSPATVPFYRHRKDGALRWYFLLTLSGGIPPKKNHS